MKEPRSRFPRKSAENKGKLVVSGAVGSPPRPVQRRLFPVKEVEIDGVVMGVLSDGTPYLTLKGLARLCGIQPPALRRLTNSWSEEKRKPRGIRIQELLAAQGHSGDALSLQTASEVETHVYTDAVCMAVLEYYAFDAAIDSSAVAMGNYRLLARSSFRTFIYQKCGYDPNNHIPESWRNFHARVLLNDDLPIGFFSVFREMADIVVHMIRGGCPLDSHTVPDISVGLLWSKHWETANFGSMYGERRKHLHVFPDWFPQALAGPVPAWVYPVDALGSFHMWMHSTYLPKAFPKYVAGKVRGGIFLRERGKELIDSVTRKGRLHLPDNRNVN